MSNSSLVSVKVPATHYSKGRSGRKIQMITIHHMAGVMSAKQCGKVFQGSRQASAHYGVGNDGEIGLYVDEANTAWANSNWDANCKAVTIETSNNKTGGNWTVGDKALNSLIKLVADIAKRNKLGTLIKGKNVTWHQMYASTACPGKYLLSKMDYIISEANKINSKSSNTKKEEYDMAKTFTNRNKSTNVYAESSLKTKIGSLDPKEVCECIGEISGKYIVKYKVNGTSTYKVGFTSYKGIK